MEKLDIPLLSSEAKAEFLRLFYPDARVEENWVKYRNTMVRGELLNNTVLQKLFEVAKECGLVISPPKRPQPDFRSVEAEPSEGLSYTLKKRAKIPVTAEGNPADPIAAQQLSTMIDVAMLAKKYDELEELRQQYHPQCPFSASIYKSPTVCEVGEKTLKIKQWSWATSYYKVVTVDIQLDLARQGYTVWRDGFAVKSNLKAVQYVPFYSQHPETWRRTILEMHKSGVKMFF